MMTDRRCCHKQMQQAPSQRAQVNKVSQGDKRALEVDRLGPVGTKITARLNSALAPSVLEVTDESWRHAGHEGARPGGETHFRIRIAARAFAGRSRVERHRMIHQALAEELRQGVHAIAIEAVADER
jgi:BolA protein